MSSHNTSVLLAKLKLVISITLVWMCIGVFIGGMEAIKYDYTSGEYSFRLPEGHTWQEHVAFNFLGPFLGGLFGAGLIVFWLRERYKHVSYGRVLVIHSTIYLLMIFAIALVVGFSFRSFHEKLPPWHPEILEQVGNFLTGPGLFKVLITWYLITAGTVFFLQINDKYGPGVLWRFMLGKYHKPSNEYRLFMFLDLRESTTIAEKLGHQEYFVFLRDVYARITKPIIEAKGEIYQYVGDEVVITWDIREQQTVNRAVACYFQIQEELQKQKQHFINRYDTFPFFKSGIHLGEVTTGEIGQIKKDIIFTGDVLNCASRLVELCRAFSMDLIISDRVYHALDNSQQQFRFDSLGEVILRGKTHQMELYGHQINSSLTGPLKVTPVEAEA